MLPKEIRACRVRITFQSKGRAVQISLKPGEMEKQRESVEALDSVVMFVPFDIHLMIDDRRLTNRARLSCFLGIKIAGNSRRVEVRGGETCGHGV